MIYLSTDIPRDECAGSAACCPFYLSIIVFPEFIPVWGDIGRVLNGTKTLRRHEPREHTGLKLRGDRTTVRALRNILPAVSTGDDYSLKSNKKQYKATKHS